MFGQEPVSRAFKTAGFGAKRSHGCRPLAVDLIDPEVIFTGSALH